MTRNSVSVLVCVVALGVAAHAACAAPKDGRRLVWSDEFNGTVLDTALTAATISDYTFYTSSPISKEIGDLTYIAPKATTDKIDTIRYVACDSKGEFEYVGKIVITNKASVVVYTKSFTDIVKTSSTEWFCCVVKTID